MIDNPTTGISGSGPRRARRVRPAMLALLGAVVLAACAGPTRMGDARAQTLLMMPTPQFAAERQVAFELAQRCPSYGWDSKLDRDMDEARTARGAGYATAQRQRGAIEVETDIKRRSVSANHGGAPFASLDPCAVLDTESERQTPLSVLVVRES